MNKKQYLLALPAVAALALTSCSSSVPPYKNPDLPAAERAADLCSRLTLDEKASIMMDMSRPVERLGVPAFVWWSEALHGIGRNGTATMFPQCIGMAASFDSTLIYDIYTAVSDEARAKYTAQHKTGKVERYQGLSFWTPNINIFRDPRWGRGQETYGEDPFMNATLGSAVVRGLQGPEGHKYRKLLACAKHFAVHSGPEKTRHHFDITDLSTRDLYETYLPAFETLVRQAGVREVMCAYQRFEGKPCCGSSRLLNQILRNDWGFTGLVVSDCGAISDFWRKGRHETSADAAAASADAVIAGTDVECGGDYRHLPEAVKRGDIKEEQMDVSLRRLLQARFELGDFDPDEMVEWTKIGPEVIASDAHRVLALQMAREQMVLLQNKGNLLPLPKSGKKIMVMGPNAADSLMLWGIYFGIPKHTVTMLEGLQAKVAPATLPYDKACEITALTRSDSQFGNFTTEDGQKGMTATYWNNEKMEGEPVTTVRYEAPISLDNGGNTVFAPGVNLENFSLRLKGKFTAEKSETLTFNYAVDDGFRLIIDGDTLQNRWRTDFLSSWSKDFSVEAGKSYDVQFDFFQRSSVAHLSFDVARTVNVTTADIVKKAKDAEVVIFVGGISPDLEREEVKVTAPGFDNGDRTSIELPQVQRDILKALKKAGKKIVLVNCSGSAVALKDETESCDAIIHAWYAGEQGGAALADVIFGDYNPSGKLPVTFYESDNDLPSFDDYNMKAGKGRTYRYFTGKPLFPFGFGLSYTSFEMSAQTWDAARGGVSLKVKNTGSHDGVEIVQVYVRDPRDSEGPVKTLRGFARVDLKAGEEKDVFIPMPRSRFALFDSSKGCMQVVPGTYELFVGNSSDNTTKLSADIQ